jgi:WD40 repeat protein
LAARVVEVIADLGAPAASRYRYGSGCIVAGGTVLTAAHVVAGAASVVVRDPDKREYTAAVDPRFVGDAGGPGPDLALVEIEDPAFDRSLPPVGLAAVDRDSGEPVEGCHAVGYPWFAETPSRTRTAVRDTVDAIGVIPVLSNLVAGLLSVQVTVTPRELPPGQTALEASQWSGMSGAPVVAAGCLLGVVSEHAPREGPSAITAVPLTALQADPAHEQWGPGVAEPAAWWSRLGVQGIGELRRLPVPPPPRQPSAYRATLREFGRALHQRMPQLLGRERELNQIAAFATGGEGYRWLAGGAFAGKSALVYEAVTVGVPDEVDVVCYFLSRRASDASSARFLAAVVPQLAYLCEADPPQAGVDQYRALWEQAAGQAVQRGRHLLLVVDGLDEDLHPPGSPSVAGLLPVLVGVHAHVLVTSRPRPGLPDDMPPGHPLTRVTPVPLDPFPGAGELAELARKEIDDLMQGDDADLAADVLGVLTAAAGPLSLSDLVALQSDRQGAPAAAQTRHVRRLVDDRAARSLERVGPAGSERYQFAHASLLEHAQMMPDLRDPEYRQRIHRWAGRWRGAGWPVPAGGHDGTPQYLLDTYSATLAQDPRRLAELAGDIGWAEAAITSAGVDAVLADLRQAASANPAATTVTAVAAAVTGQAYDLRPPQPVGQPGYILRQLWMQAAELAEDDLAEQFRSRLQSRPGPGLVPRWTTRRASRALSGELGRHHGPVWAVAVLPGGRVVTGGDDRRVLVWDPAAPGAGPAELGRHDGAVQAVAALADGRVVTGGSDGRVLVWDPAVPGAGPAELGRYDGGVQPVPDAEPFAAAVHASVAALADGRVVTGGSDGRVLVWDPAVPGAGPAELGRHDGVSAVAALADGRVVTGGSDGRVLVWDPAAPGAGPAELGRYDGEVQAVAALPDGRVVTGDNGGRMLVWDPAAPGAAPAELGRHDIGVWAVAALPGGRVGSGGYGPRVLIWDPAAPGAAPAELGRHDGPVSAVAALPDGRVVTGGFDGRVLIWDPAVPGVGPAELGRYDDMVAMLPDGRVVTGGPDGRVLVWDPAVPGVGPAELGRYDGEVQAVAVLPGGWVVTGDSGGRVLVWDPAAPGAGPAELGRHDDRVWAVAALPDGRVVTGGGDGRVLVWDPAVPGAGAAELGPIGNLVTTVTTVAVLPDGRVVTGGPDGRVLVWDPAAPGAGPTQLNGHDGAVQAVAGVAVGRVVAGGFDGRVLVWDPAAPGAAPAELGRHDGPVWAVAALPGGRVVTGGDDRRVVIWDPARANTQVIQLSCRVASLATAPPSPARPDLVIAHGDGFSLWSFKE